MTRTISTRAGRKPALPRDRWRHFGLGGTPASAQTPLSVVMSRTVTCVHEDLSVPALTALLLEHGLHGAPVVDDRGALVGFISMTDLLRDRSERCATEPAPATVGELMMPWAISLEESAPLALAIALMSCEDVHQLPVVSADEKVVGLLSSLDVLRWLAQDDGYRTPAAMQLERMHQ